MPPRRQRSLYAEPECYIDYENESPFLIPPPLNGVKSAPQHSKHSNSKRKSSRANFLNSTSSAGASSSSTAANSARIQVTRSSSNAGQLTRTSSSDHSYGTAVALIDMDSSRNNGRLVGTQQQQQQQLETVRGSSSESSLSRVSSLGLGSLGNGVTAAARSNSAHVRVSNQEQATFDLMPNSDNEITASTLLLATAASSAATVPSYYLDEKPPSYDDIIRQNV